MGRTNSVSLIVIVNLIFITGGLLRLPRIAQAQTKNNKRSSGWESDKTLVRRDVQRWRGGAYALPHIARNLRGDGKWVMIAHRHVNNYSPPLGYYYDPGKNRWIGDKTLVNGLKTHCWQEYSALAHNVTGDNKWTLISHCSRTYKPNETFYGYYWDGTKWVEDSSRVKGLPNIGGKTSHILIKDLKGDGKWTLLTGGAKPGAKCSFTAFYWNRERWVEDPSRVNGLPNMRGPSRPTAGLNIFGDKKWSIIATTKTSRSFRVFCWNGKQWMEDKTKAAGLTSDLPELCPTLVYNLRGNGKWVLISGVGQHYTLLGFQYNSVDTSSFPSQKNVTSQHPLATTVRIRFSYPKTWNHRVKYSIKPDMSDTSWSKWFKDMDNLDVKLEGLNPKTTYYYQVYTYVPWDTSHYVKTAVKTFTTKASQNPVTVKPGGSIQDALETLPLAGGTIELAKGVHDVRDTIVINRSNIIIQGTHESEIRIFNPKKTVFIIPHEHPSPREDWANMPVLENLTFKGFKVTSSYTKRRGGIIICAWNVRNLTVEDIFNNSRSSYLVAVNPTGEYTKARGENIFIRNNTSVRSAITFGFSKNVHVIGNIIRRSSTMCGIDINNSNRYVYIKNNKVYGGANYNIRGHSGRHIWIDNNTLLGGSPIGIFMDGISHVTISNNTITGCSRAAIQVDPQPPLKINIINNRIYGNRGHGIVTTEHSGHHNSVVDLTNNVISNNGGDGIYMKVNWVRFRMVANNIIANNKGYGINYIKTFEPTIIKYNNVWNNAKGNYNNTRPGTGDISADPLFSAPSKGDFHLKSKASRWEPKAKKWVKDKVHSPCIDAGDPKAEFSKEPMPNGGKVNIGAYGNTAEASKSIVR